MTAFSMTELSPPVAIHRCFRFPAGFLVAFVLAAVPNFLTLRQGDFAFGNAIAEVNPQRNDGQTFGLGAARPFVNFILVKKEFAVTERFVIPRAASQILGNVSIHQPWTTGLEVYESVANVGLSFAQS